MILNGFFVFERCDTMINTCCRTLICGLLCYDERSPKFDIRSVSVSFNNDRLRIDNDNNRIVIVFYSHSFH